MKDLSRRRFIARIAAATTAMTSPEILQASNTRMNVLFIGVDDLTTTALGYYGNNIVKTPHLDALAAQGVCFKRGYCQYPLCNPSRSSMLSGFAPDRTQILNNEQRFRNTIPSAVTLPQLFRKNGYHTMRVGKIFHAGNPGDIGRDGADDPASWDTVYNPAGVDHTKEEPSITNYTPQRDDLGSSLAFYESPAPDRIITDSRGADEVIRLLKENKHKLQPFFLAYGLYRPHVPWVVPSSYFEQYPMDSIHPPHLDPGETKNAPPAAYSSYPTNFGMSGEQIRICIRSYYAATSFMDAQVGRVLHALRENNLDKNTVIVFWGDHGWALGDHGQWQKNMLFEPVARVPLIIAGPGIAKQPCTRTGEHLDIYPTMVELCGLQNPSQHLQGTSLCPLLRNPEVSWEKPAVTQLLRVVKNQSPVTGYSTRNERYRYTKWSGGQAGEELYDYDTDPHEKKNLANDKHTAALRAELCRQLKRIVASRKQAV